MLNEIATLKTKMADIQNILKVMSRRVTHPGQPQVTCFASRSLEADPGKPRQ